MRMITKYAKNTNALLITMYLEAAWYYADELVRFTLDSTKLITLYVYFYLKLICYPFLVTDYNMLLCCLLCVISWLHQFYRIENDRLDRFLWNLDDESSKGTIHLGDNLWRCLDGTRLGTFSCLNCWCLLGLTHSCPPFQHLLFERLTSLGIMGGTRSSPIMPRDVSLSDNKCWRNRSALMG